MAAGKALPAIPVGIIARVGSAAELWSGLVLPDAVPGSPRFSVVAIYDLASAAPLLLATPLDLPPRVLACPARFEALAPGCSLLGGLSRRAAADP